MTAHGLEESKTGEPLLKVTASLAKKAAKAALRRYLREDRDEVSTRDLTATVLPYCESVVVCWAYEDKRGNLINKSREFKISVI